jgi:hypothetical protein
MWLARAGDDGLRTAVDVEERIFAWLITCNSNIQHSNIYNAEGSNRCDLPPVWVLRSDRPTHLRACSRLHAILYACHPRLVNGYIPVSAPGVVEKSPCLVMRCPSIANLSSHALHWMTYRPLIVHVTGQVPSELGILANLVDDPVPWRRLPV